MNRDQLLAAANEPNVRAFLHAIRACEGTAGPDGYRTLYGGALFYGYQSHPNTPVTAGGYTSTAAGSYQFLWKTWSALNRQYQFPDFSPQWQDAAAVALLVEKGALAAVRAGRLAEAVKLCAPVWASLPGAPYGQPTRPMTFVADAYRRSGGQLEPQATATAPTPQETTAMSPLAIPALTILAELIPALSKLFKGENPSRVAERNLAVVEMIADKVLPAVVGATGAANVEDAIRQVQTNPNAAKAAEEAVEGIYYQLVEVGGGIKAAREHTEVMTGTGPVWRQVGYGLMLAILSIGVVLGGGALMGWLLMGGLEAQLAAQVLDYFKAAGFIVLGYVFGSSADSRRKTDLLAGEK